MAGLGDLVVRLSAETAQFTQALDKASYQSQKNFDRMVSSAKTAGVAIAGAFAIGEFANMTRKAMAFADTMQDVATANDVGVESILALSEALSQNGGKSENAGKMLSSLTAKIYEASEGSKTAQEAFRSAGISINDLGKLSTIELFDKLIVKLAGTKDAALRNGMAMEFFGKAAKGVDFVGLSQGTAQQREEFLKYAQAIQLSADLNDKLEAKTMKTMVMFNTTFIPTMNAVYDSANKGGSAFESMMVFGGEAFKGLVYGARTLVTGLQTVNASVNLVGLTLSDIGSGKFNTFFDRLKEYDAYVGDLRKKDKEFARELMKNNADNKKALNGKGDINRPIKTPKEELSAMAEAISINEKFNASMSEMIAKKRLAMATPFMSEEERKLQEDMIAIQKSYSDAQANLNKLTKDGKLSAGQYQVELDKLQTTYQNATESARLLFEEQQKLNGSWEYGASTALAKYVNESKNLATLTNGVVSSALTGMDNALFGIISRTSSVADAFRNMTASILSDIAKIMIRQQISAPIAQALGGLFTGGQVSYGNYLQTQTGITVDDNGNSLMVGGGKALGGSVNGGTSYLVGEKGAEVFTPAMNGTITPNSSLGGETIINQTINIQTGVAQTVRTEIQSMMPRIMEATKAAVADSKLRGGTYGRMMA